MDRRVAWGLAIVAVALLALGGVALLGGSDTPPTEDDPVTPTPTATPDAPTATPTPTPTAEDPPPTDTPTETATPAGWGSDYTGTGGSSSSGSDATPQTPGAWVANDSGGAVVRTGKR